VATRLRKSEISDRGNILIFDKGVALDLRNELRWRAQVQMIEADPNDIMVFFLETDRASGSFGGGRFAPPVAFA
jgi:hypothetical protein